MDNRFGKVIDNFRTVVSIPRPSGAEEQISKYLVEFGEKLGLDVEQDNALNVIIRKPGCMGYENSPPIILQGHMDIVYVTDDAEPLIKEITVVEDNGWLRADGTSLGADNGIALAYIMTILQSGDIPHPPIEALFTTNEETGLHGAIALDPGKLTGRRLINLDSGRKETLIAGCAGGVDAAIKIPVKMKPVNADDRAIEIRIQGLRGGHSGGDIDKQKANAIKLLGRILYDLSSHIEYGLVSIDGGIKKNAIPIEAHAVLTVASVSSISFEQFLGQWQKTIRNEYSDSDPDITVTCDTCSYAPSLEMSEKTKSRVLGAIMTVPHGVHDMELKIPGLVRSSSNLAIISTSENNVVLTSLIRSSVGSIKTFLAESISCMAKASKGTVHLSDEYPEWQFSENSPLRDTCAKVYKNMWDNTPIITAIHGGLECGVFARKFPDMDMVSFGPVIQGAHTTGEKMNIESAHQMWEYLLAILGELK